MRIGPYSLHGTIAAGGFGQVDYATVDDGNGLTKLVAVKRMRADRANDEALAMLADEARLVSRIRHPNVIGVLDVLQHDAELFVVMEYVDGETLAFFLRRAQRKNDPIPLPIVSAIVVGALEGLHAAHEAVDEDGAPLGIVHRDVSLPNIMVGADGLSRILDFGVAKAEGRQQSTVVGELKGKLAYMAPEQLALEPVTPRSDVYAVGVVLWELIASRRLFDSPDGAVTISKVLKGEIEPPSKYASGVPEALEILVIRALSRDPADRFASGAEMAAELAACVAPASTNEVAAWVGAASVDSTTKKPPGVGEARAAGHHAGHRDRDVRADDQRVGGAARATAAPDDHAGDDGAPRRRRRHRCRRGHEAARADAAGDRGAGRRQRLARDQHTARPQRRDQGGRGGRREPRRRRSSRPASRCVNDQRHAANPSPSATPADAMTPTPECQRPHALSAVSVVASSAAAMRGPGERSLTKASMAASRRISVVMP